MKSVVHVGVRLGLVMMLAFPLMGARCNTSRQYTSGSSQNIQGVAGSGTDWQYGSFPYDPLTFAGDLFDQVNTQRLSQGLNRLKWHDGLAMVCQKHSVDMRTRNYLSLVTPEGTDLAQRLVSSNPRIDFDQVYKFVSFTRTPTQVFSILMNNIDARLAIQDHNMTHFGASFQANPGPYYITILIGRNVRP